MTQPHSHPTFPFGLRDLAATPAPAHDDVLRPQRHPPPPKRRTLPPEACGGAASAPQGDTLARRYVEVDGATTHTATVFATLPESTAGERTPWLPEEDRLLETLLDDADIATADAFVAEYEHATGKRRSPGALADRLAALGLALRCDAATLYVTLRGMAASTLPTPPINPPSASSKRPRYTGTEDALLIDGLREADDSTDAWLGFVRARSVERGGPPADTRTTVAYAERLRRLRNAGSIPAHLIPVATRRAAELKARGKPVAPDDAVVPVVPAISAPPAPAAAPPAEEIRAPDLGPLPLRVVQLPALTPTPRLTDATEDAVAAAMRLYSANLLDRQGLARVLTRIADGLAD